MDSLDAEPSSKGEIKPPTATSDVQDIAALASLFHESNFNDSFPTCLVDECTAISDLVDIIADLPTDPPSLYLDLEGVHLSRHGSISILQVHISTDDQTYLVDVHTLGDKAFSTIGASGQTLKGILESDSIPKVFFDVRNDSDALFIHFQIRLAGIHDLQLMELATRNFSKKCINELAKCIERDVPLSVSETHGKTQKRRA